MTLQWPLSIIVQVVPEVIKGLRVRNAREMVLLFGLQMCGERHKEKKKRKIVLLLVSKIVSRMFGSFHFT